MPSFCVVSNCEYKYTHAENVSFHKFPSSSKTLAKWIEFTDRGPKWQPSRWSAICSRHFLPSDFRNLISRKCLKKDAVPSITIKQFTGNFLDFQRNEKAAETKSIENSFQGTDDQAESNCRLCGICCKSAETFATNFEVFGMIQKCFPTFNIQLDDDLPKNICSTCLDRLHLFSDFVDEVLKTQKELEAKFANEPNSELNAPLVGKALKIKQEPVIKVKQEVNETGQSNISEDYDNEINDELECDQKTNLQDSLAIINSREIINNCDIIEIVTLDDAFIDIPDDEAGEIESNAIFVNPGEHSYARTDLPSKPIVNQPLYKLENSDDLEFDHQLPNKPNIVVIDESILQAGPNLTYFQCESCAMTFLSETDLTEHKNLDHTPILRRCNVCNIQFISFYKFLKHKNQFHNESKRRRVMKKKANFSCPMCDKIFSSKLALNNHRKYICDYQQEQEHECKHCGRKLNRWILLRRHEKICKGETNTGDESHALHLTFNNPTIIDSTAIALQQSQSRIEPNAKGQFVCPVCDRTYSRRHNLFKHQITHRPEALWNHKCGDCNKLFDHIYDLRRHLKSEQCIRNVQQQQQQQQQQKPKQLFFICTICGKQLKTLQRLKQHCISHSGKRPYVCELCGKSFANVNNLYQHRITHSDIRRYKCDLCEKVFKRRGGLNQHKRAYHFKIKPHECPICKHRYALKGDMIRCKHSLMR